MTEQEIHAERERLEDDLIFGKFVVAFTKPPNDNMKLNEDYKMLYIRLSEIKTVAYLWRFEDDGLDACYFNTYKDCRYFTYLNAANLVKAINHEHRIDPTLAPISEQLQEGG